MTEPAHREPFHAVTPAPCPTSLALQIRKRYIGRPLVRRQQLARDVLIINREEHAHALRSGLRVHRKNLGRVDVVKLESRTDGNAKHGC